jgi:dipeptidyl aminopeptidase/acylaminoacyl peptidase
MKVDDLFAVQRVSDPQISPDGKYIAVVVGTVSMEENRVNTDIWLIPTDAPTRARCIVASPKADNHPRWSSDGKLLSFVSTRSGTPQVYVLSMEDILASSDKPSGKEQQITSLSTGARAQYFSPDGKYLSFVSNVFPEFSFKPFAEAERLCKERLEALEVNPVKARVFDRLLYRHWDSWTDGTRQHIFIQALVDGKPVGEPRNLTPGEQDAIPNADTFSAGDDYAWSPDSKEIAYTATHAPVREEAWQTNHNIVLVSVETGVRTMITGIPTQTPLAASSQIATAGASADVRAAAKTVLPTLAAKAYPRYSPDGSYLAFRAQSVAGFEADRWQLYCYHRASGMSNPIAVSLTSKWDASVQAFEWSPDSKRIILEAEENAETLLWSVHLDSALADAKTSAQNSRKAAIPSYIKRLTTFGTHSAPSIARDGTLCFTNALFTQPAEVFILRNEGPVQAPVSRKLSVFNDVLLAMLDLPQPEKIYYLGARVKNQAWLLRPPQFDPKKKYPVVFLIHGGPQGAWGNSWSHRWNPQVWAAQGYVVVMPNPTGSTGFGQEFVNGVSRDWGGKPFVDIMKCVDFVLATYPFADKQRLAAAGASYGGYMVNWIATQTNRFKTLVSHCGVYNFTSMYGTTDEVWFDEWEHGKPWESGFEAMQKQSPHKFVQNITTPMLIIHDGNDFRVPLSEGMQLFTVLQRRGVSSKFLYIPDEGHWVLKPQNSRFWHATIFDWLATYLK